MKRIKKVIASIAISGMALSMMPFNVLAQDPVAVSAPVRLGGYTAAQTAVQIAEQTGWTGTAILSSSTSYGMVDALTAGPLATFLKAPILLQEAGNVLNPDTKAELIKLNVNTVYVTSGTAVISQAVLDQLTGMGIKVVSLGGIDRFETSVNIAKQMIALGANVSKVAVAYGWLNQDALSIAAIASAQTQPILLTEKDNIPASVWEFLNENPSITATDVIGGTGVVSESVKNQLPNATRHFGYTAYDTNLAVLKAYDGVLKFDRLFIANGETAVDALAGAPLAALYNAGIVLTKGTANEATAYAKSKLSSTSVVTALGGTAVVPEGVMEGVTPPEPETPVDPEEPATPGGGGGSGGGGGGGGDQPPVQTTASVSTADELTTALNNANITTITFTGNITKDLTITRSLTINFGAFVLTGNVTFNHSGEGTSTLTGTAAPSITGTLTVDTENASFVNNVVVGGGVNVVNVEPGTYTEKADGNTITITDDDGSSITVEGKPGSITVTQAASGALTITVNAGATVGSIISNAPITLKVEGTAGTVTANAAITMEVATTATVTDINVGANAAGSSITNNGTATNITVEAGADGTTITNNGTVNYVTTNAPINLVANKAPGATTTGSDAVVITTTGTESANVAPVSLTNYIDAVNTANAGQVIDALKALALISPLAGSTLNPDNAAYYVAAFDVPPVPTTVTEIRARVDALNTARSDLQAAITKAGTKVQADYTAASWTAMQTALATANNVNTGGTATATDFTNAATALTNAINGLVLMPKITATTISGAALTDDALTFSFANLRRDSGLSVSKDTKLSLSIGDSGPIGYFNLKAGQANTLLSAPLPTNTDLNLTQTNMTAIFNAIKNLDSANKQAILNTVDFAKVLELVKQAGQATQDQVFQQIGFKDFYAAIRNADPLLKNQIIDNMTQVIDVSLAENSAEFKNAVEDIMTSVVLQIPSLSDTQKATLVDFYLSQNTDVATLLKNLNLTVEQKDSLLTNMDYTALFDAVMNYLQPATRANMFKAVNFTDLFTAMKSADAAQKAAITDNLVNVMNTIEASDIPRTDMLDALVFGANKRDALFQILLNLCAAANGGVAVDHVMLTVTLTDDANNTKTYNVTIDK